MRKYYFAFILILSGISILTYIYIQNNRTVYSETVFSDESKVFNESFTGFTEEVNEKIELIRSNFPNSDNIRDTTNTQKFFLNFMKESTFLIAVGLFQNEYKIGVNRDNKSVVYASDSTEAFDVVRWQRFENEKFISSWEESFEKPINETPWYKKLSKNFDQTRWFFESGLKENGNNELFYAGYSYEFEGGISIILFRFERLKLSENFETFSKFKNVKLLVETTQERTMDLSSNNMNSFQDVEDLDIKSDSLTIHTINHFKKFDKQDQGIFKFKYHDKVYWNSFQRFPAEAGILYYLLTIPDSEIQNTILNNMHEILLWVGLILVLLGILTLFIKSRIFYQNPRSELPSVEEILKEDENRYLEFKSSSRYDYRQEKHNPVLEQVIFKTVAAFGNTDGGILLIGVDDDKNIIGLEKDFSTLKKSTADYYEVHLRNNLHNLMGVRYVSKYIRMQFEICENEKIVCKIKVFAAKEPLYLKMKNKNGLLEEKFYVRSGNSSQEIKSIAEINEYINTRFKK